MTMELICKFNHDAELKLIGGTELKMVEFI